MFKKILAVILGALPLSALASDPAVMPAGYIPGTGNSGFAPSAAVSGDGCSISGGVLTCAGALGNFVAPGNVAPGDNKVPGDISYAGLANRGDGQALPGLQSVSISGALLNEIYLSIAPGSSLAGPANGALTIGGYVYNGTLDGATFDDNPVGAVNNSRLVLEGGSVTISGHDANGVAILNAGKNAIAGNVGVGGNAYHNSVTAAESLSIKTNVGDVAIVGDIWNNTADGVTARQTLAQGANSVIMGVNSARDIYIGNSLNPSNLVNFGGGANFNAARAIEMVGDVLSSYGTVNFASGTGDITVGNVTQNGTALGIVMNSGGALNVGNIALSAGSGTFSSVKNIAAGIISNTSASALQTNFTAGTGFVSGNITNSATAGLGIHAGNGITAGQITNSGGELVLDPGTGRLINAAGIASNTGGAISVISGDYISVGAGNITAAGDMYVGSVNASSTAGNIYLTPTHGVVVGGLRQHNVSSTGAVNIAGNLNIASGNGLYFSDGGVGGPTSAVISFGGTVTNAGVLSVLNAFSWNSGAINNNGTLSNPALVSIATGNSGSTTNNITTGAVVNGSYSTIALTADDNLNMASFSNLNTDSGNATLSTISGDINVGISPAGPGYIQNFATETDPVTGMAAQMNILSGRNITTSGSVENSGSYMRLLAGTQTAPGAITVGGTMKNDMAGGTGQLLIGTSPDASFDFAGIKGNLVNTYQVASLTINGGGLNFSVPGQFDASLVNSGVFKAVVQGNTKFNWGVDQTAAGPDGIFYLDTGTLTFGNSTTTSGINEFYANLLGTFIVRVQNSDINSNNIINGAQVVPTYSGGSWDYSPSLLAPNPNANMRLEAQNIKASGQVVNIGQDMILTSNATTYSGGATGGNLWITGNLFNGTGDGVNAVNNGSYANTQLLALQGGSTANTGGILAVDGVVSNFAGLELNGEKEVRVGTVTDNGSGVMRILSRADTGKIILGGVINNGSYYSGGSPCVGTSCNIHVSAKDISITGQYLGNSGTALISGSSVSFGSIYMLDGRLDVTGMADVTVAGDINQSGGKAQINTNYLSIGGGINAFDLTVGATSSPSLYLTVDVANNVSGGAKFIGLGDMHVGGDYVFGDSSMLNMLLLPLGTLSTENHFGTIGRAEDAMYGKITNSLNISGTIFDATPIIKISGAFQGDVSGDPTNPPPAAGNAALANGQMGVTIFDVIDEGNVIWLVYADGGVEDYALPTRDIPISYCNADGSKCFNYLTSLRRPDGTKYTSPTPNGSNTGSKNPDDLPAYLSVRDSDGDFIKDSIYVVFDPTFGGPATINKLRIQPIVNRQPDHTGGEYDTAGALDNLVDGGLASAGFAPNSPIEAMAPSFQGTIFETMANELYDRMDMYVSNFEGKPLARFSRLFQPRELDIFVHGINMADHTWNRDFETRMLDEFLWNRNRYQNKAWLDFDIGNFTHSDQDDNQIKGNVFQAMGGFDFQYNDETILGLSARISRSNSSMSDTMDLGYKGTLVPGHVDLDATTTSFGVGGYLQYIMTPETMRLYGNVFIDTHILDMSRDQNFMEHISGTGNSFAISTEWGLMHDILNQYVVGNLHVRASYNFGFDVTEKVQGDTYMQLHNDGFASLTPGYSLSFQKRWYMTSWFQIRPTALLGVEYDVLGMSDSQMNFKFGPAYAWEKYNVTIDPLWAVGQIGLDFISVGGAQFGVNYRYQWNPEMQIQMVRLTGSYRF